MAKFEIAESITGRNEGGYANNPADTGGETFAGIARNHWPKWKGWIDIDRFKSQYTSYKQTAKKPMSLAAWINASAKATQSLLDEISKFYKFNFWDSLKLDLFQDQQLANSVYDFGVNSGTVRAAKFLQEALGFKSKDVDGKIGNQTLGAVNKENPKELTNKYNSRREQFYRSIAKGNQSQFLKSWLSRLKPYK